MIRDLTIRFHPSTIMNNNSLKGRDMDTGGSMNIPIDISMLETTISITIKGIKIRKPISKAVFSSLITNAGIKTIKDVSSGFCISVFDAFAKRARSF
jgi:hypothetical protein